MAAFWLVNLEHDWSSLVAGLPVRQAAKESVLYLQGAPVRAVHVILEGRVRLVSHTAPGQERHVAVIGANGLVGDCGFWAEGRHQTGAVASTDIRHVELAPQRLAAALHESPLLMRQLLAFGDQRFRVMLQHHALLGAGSALQRVCFALHGLVTLYGAPHPCGQRIGMRFTQEEMASICSVSRVSVATVLGSLAQRGVIAREGRDIIVRDMPFLAAPTER